LPPWKQLTQRVARWAGTLVCGKARGTETGSVQSLQKTTTGFKFSYVGLYVTDEQGHSSGYTRSEQALNSSTLVCRACDTETGSVKSLHEIGAGFIFG